MIESRVKTIMKDRGIAIRKLVLETGLSSGTVHRARGDLIEKCTLNTLEKIADVLGVGVKDLFVQK